MIGITKDMIWYILKKIYNSVFALYSTYVVLDCQVNEYWNHEPTKNSCDFIIDCANPFSWENQVSSKKEGTVT